MDRSEMESLIRQLKAQGLGEKDIMDVFYETFKEGKMDRKDLEECSRFMGYELTDEFKNDPTPDPIAGGAGAEGITQEQAEAAKEIKPGESQADFQESISGGSEPSEPNEGDPNPAKEEPKSEEDDDEKGWQEAQKKLKW